MGLLDSLKDRAASNLKFTRLTFMNQQNEIIAFCQSLTPNDRVNIIKGIESHFKWQSVASVAQALFPAQSYGGGVSAESLDMVTHGQIGGGLELMRQENQVAPQQTAWGMMPQQQAALSFAWLVLKGMEQRESLLRQSPATTATSGRPPNSAFCTSCGLKRCPGLYCVHCGARFS